MKKNVFTTAKECFAQEGAATSALACIRTLLSAEGKAPSEEELIENTPACVNYGNSEEIRCTGGIQKYTTKAIKIAMDERVKVINPAMELASLLEEYNVMINCFIGSKHWFVVLGYVGLDNGVPSYFILYDTKYDKVRTLTEKELLESWESESFDYVAIFK